MHQINHLPPERMTQEQRRVDVGDLEWQATFVSADGDWHGESSFVRCVPGKDNVIEVPVKKKSAAVRIGGWCTAPGGN